MALGDDVQISAASSFKKIVSGAKKTISFLRTGAGIVVLKLVAITLTLVFIYILGEVIFDSVAKILFKNNTGLGTDEYNRSSEFLQNLSNSGYDSMVNADQLMKYYSFEYAVLMDEAEYIETHGVYLLEKQNEGVIEWQDITKEQWNDLAAKALSHEDHKFREGDFGTHKPEEHIPGNHDEKMELAQDTLYYRPLKNEYTQIESLIPIFRATRRDTYLRYFMEHQDITSSSNTSEIDVEFKNNTWNTNTEFGNTPDDGPETAYAQKTMAHNGDEYNIQEMEDEVTGEKDIPITATESRYELEGGVSDGNTQKQSSRFIAAHVNPTYWSRPLNDANTAAILSSDTQYNSPYGRDLDVNQNYSENNLFYYRRDMFVNYDVPLRVLLDRFLPNASLLSSWRLLTNDGSESEETGSVAEDLVNDIMDIYNDACLTGESTSPSLWLLKEVGVNTKEVSEHTTAQSLLKNGSFAIQPVLEDAAEGETKYDSYLPKYDSRGADYKSKVNTEAPKAAQSFSGSMSDEVADNIRLAFRHHENSSNSNLGEETLNSLIEAVTGAMAGEGGGGDIEATNDISVASTSAENGLAYYYCKGSDEGGVNSTILNHYGLSSAEGVEVKVSNNPFKHTEVYVNGQQVEHVENADCRVVSSRVSYEIKDGLMSTAIILHEGDKYYGYVVRDKEIASNEVGSYTNDHSFCEIESGELQSTTFKHWEYSSKDPNTGENEKSYESWLVTDAFEGLDYEIKITDGQGPQYWGKLYTGPGPSYEVEDYYYDGVYKESFKGGGRTGKEERMYKEVAPEQDDRDGFVPDTVVFSFLMNEKYDYVKKNQIYHKRNFTIVRSGEEFTESVDQMVPPREDKYKEEGQTDPVKNAAMDRDTEESVARVENAKVTTTHAKGETKIPERNYLVLKKLQKPIKTTDECPLYIKSTEEKLRAWQVSQLYNGYGTPEEAKPDDQPVMETWENIAWYMYQTDTCWDYQEMNPDEVLVAQTGLSPVEKIPTIIKEQTQLYRDVMEHYYTTYFTYYPGVWSSPPDNFGWNDSDYWCGWDTINNIDPQFNVVMPTRVTVQSITQRVVDRKMPAWFVYKANYWAGEKEFHNVEIIKGEFKDINDWRYLVSDNDDAIGIKNIKSEYEKLKWRCKLFAPIFGSARADNSGREGDIKLILAEWEQVGNNGTGAADHAIRDLNSLIQYTKGVKDENGEFEPLLREEAENVKSGDKAYINENSYTYLYIPDEILGYNELTCEAAFWMDRIICTKDDEIYDKEETDITDTASTEGKMRSRLPTFTWQIVDYNLYDETRVGQNVHSAYALWPFGGQNSRLMHAIGVKAEAGGEELARSSEGWGGFNEAHHGSDLYGRDKAASIYKSVYGKSKKDDEDRDNVSKIFGYSFFGYKVNDGDREGPIITAKYDAGAKDAFLYVDGQRTNNIDTSQYLKGPSKKEDKDKGVIDAQKLFGIPPFEDILANFTMEDATKGLTDETGETQVTLTLGTQTYTINGTAPAVYAYQAYRQALLTKDKTGKETEKTLKKDLEKEAQWSEIRAIAPGVVRNLGGDAIQGFWIEMTHEDGMISYYCHMKRYPLVQVGEYLGAGSIIGYEGSTGRSQDIIHLHIGIKRGDGEEYDANAPTKYMYPFFAPFWYQEKADEALEHAENKNVILDSEYFTPARTIYAYKQAGVDISRDSQGNFSLGNPELALASNADNLKEPKDADDYISPTVEDYITRDGDAPDYQGQPLHTNLDFSAPEFIEFVADNNYRINGTYDEEFGSYSGGFNHTFGWGWGTGRVGAGGGGGMGGHLEIVDPGELWDILVEIFGNEYAAAGILANMLAESGLQSNNLENTANGNFGVTDEQYTEHLNAGGNMYARGWGYGLCQWTGDRHENLINWMREHGYDVSDARGQMEFLKHEIGETPEGYYEYGWYSGLNGRYLTDIFSDENTLLAVGRACPAGAGITDEELLKCIGASEVWLHGFERPLDQEGNMYTRANAAIDYYTQYAGTYGQHSGNNNGSSQSGSGGLPTR